MQEDFRIYFNRNRQFVLVFLHDVHPNTFERRKGGRWGYYLSKWEHPRRGLFGELHFVKSRVRVDAVSHELKHVIWDWIFAKNLAITPRNEEWFCKFDDELIRKFYREHDKLSGKKRR